MKRNNTKRPKKPKRHRTRQKRHQIRHQPRHQTREKKHVRSQKKHQTNQKKAKGVNDINIISLNASWESLRPAEHDWKYKKGKYGEPPDLENGLGFQCGPYKLTARTKRCRRNVSNILKAEDYDLIALQEYVPDSINFDNNMIPISHTVNADTPKLKLEIHILSLYNQNKFTLIDHIGEEFLLAGKGPRPKRWGRPFLILFLINKATNQPIIFINVHMPQSENIEGKTPIEQARNTERRINEMILTKIHRLNKPEFHAADIIFAGDTNDFKMTSKEGIIDRIKILEKELYFGNNLQKTCCTTSLIPVESEDPKSPCNRRDISKECPFIKAPLKNYSDIILYSKNNNFTYSFPPIVEPASDHIPISTILTLSSPQETAQASEHSRSSTSAPTSAHSSVHSSVHSRPSTSARSPQQKYVPPHRRR